MKELTLEMFRFMKNSSLVPRLTFHAKFPGLLVQSSQAYLCKVPRLTRAKFPGLLVQSSQAYPRKVPRLTCAN